jgi:hypothetical protein
MSIDGRTMLATWTAVESMRLATEVVFDDNVAAVVAAVALATAMAAEDEIIKILADIVVDANNDLRLIGKTVGGFSFDTNVIDQAHVVATIISSAAATAAAFALGAIPTERIVLPIRRRIGRLAFTRRH